MNIMTLLWTNPDPSSNFSAGDIKLDLTPYQFVLILTYGTSGIYKSVMGLVGTTVGILDVDNTFRWRTFGILSNKITVGVGAYATSYNGSITEMANATRPYKIYGIKLPT